MNRVDGGEGDVCANCGKYGGDTVKLKKCTACRLVNYCGVDCQKAHRKQHKKACKQRAAELKEEQLYSQGHEREEGGFCPICTLPMPFPVAAHSVVSPCCLKSVCGGCSLAAAKRGMEDCPFCRTPFPKDDSDTLAMVQARVEKKDPVAIYNLGKNYFYGAYGLQKDMRKAFQLYHEAAELGSTQALYNLGNAYYLGDGVKADEAKSLQFYEKGAVRGSAFCRYELGTKEGSVGKFSSAYRHLLISAKMGHKESVEAIKNIFMVGAATKEQYDQAVKGYQDAAEEMKSPEREEAKIIKAMMASGAF